MDCRPTWGGRLDRPPEAPRPGALPGLKRIDYSIQSSLARSIVWRSAASSISGKRLPRRSARRKIPSHALALKEYLAGALSSKIEDKVDAAATLGDAPVLSIKNSVSKAPSVSDVTVVHVLDPRALARHRHVLTGRAEGDDVDRLDLSAAHAANVAQMLHTREP